MALREFTEFLGFSELRGVDWVVSWNWSGVRSSIVSQFCISEAKVDIQVSSKTSSGKVELGM